MRTACVLALFAAASLALTVAPASAKPGNPKAGGNSKAAPGNPKAGGNSKAAHQCQHGGWKNLLRADQTRFKNTGACVSYAARGGTLTPKPAAQLLCESLGGVFAPGSGNTLWFCTYSYTNAAFNALANRCFADILASGGSTGSFGFVSGNSSGLRTDACTRF
ncbi:MAG TPA: hypothetical protein VHJ58_14245 [Vicinamibacterales bacterium]|jgi:hypothetical protein|nr:hypothetical protein [Vicinamibacterales bacterium]